MLVNLAQFWKFMNTFHSFVLFYGFIPKYLSQLLSKVYSISCNSTDTHNMRYMMRNMILFRCTLGYCKKSTATKI